MAKKHSDWYIPTDWLFMLLLHVGIVAIAVVAGMILPLLAAVRHGEPAAFALSLFLASVGILLLFLSRIPLYREGKFLTFGPASLPENHRRIYWSGYGMVAAGAAIMTRLILMYR